MDCKTNALKNEGIFIETDSKNIECSINKALPIIINQSKNICRIIKNQKTIGTGFLCNIPNPTFSNLFPVLITSNNILKHYDFKKDKQIILQLAKEKQKTLIVNDERKIYSCNKGDYDVLFVEIKQNDELDINNFLEIDESLYKKNELVPNVKEKDIYLMHYPEDDSKIIYTFTTMNKVSSDKYKINNLKTINKCLIGCPILNYSNFKIIGVFNSNEENRLNQEMILS